jgi:1-acyl-sn-glycerol-3-phosphate acyltransferase
MYAVLKILMRFTLLAFFRKITVQGKENVPSKGPFILVANHPSAFMDPVVVATYTKQPLYFIAAGEYVGTGFKGWFFKKFLHMIPVFRPSTRPEETHKNSKMFEKCTEHLTNNKTLLVFPEGKSVTDKKIKTLKTGVARIARAAELENNFELGLAIIPVGLNYSDPHSFRSDLYVKIGEPIRVSDHVSENPEDEINEVKNLTQLIEDELIKTVLHIDDPEEEETFSLINSIYASDLKTEMGIEFHDQEEEFELNKTIIDVIDYFKSSAPEKYREMMSKVDEYASKLSTHQLTDKDIKNIHFQLNFRRITSYILGLPFFLVGLVGNILPYSANAAIQNRLHVKGSFQGSIMLAIGFGMFLIWYITSTLLLATLTPLSYWAAFLPVILYITGIYALIYRAAIHYSKKRNNLRKFAKNNKEACQDLVRSRNHLIAKFDEFRTIYDNRPELIE